MNCIPCMGGWCSVRESCRNYHAESWHRPAERLCSPNLHDCWAPTATQPEQIAEFHLLSLIQRDTPHRCA